MLENDNPNRKSIIEDKSEQKPLLVKDLKLGTTLFCVPVNVCDPEMYLEVYEVSNCYKSSFNEDVYVIKANCIIGIFDPLIHLPKDGNLNDVIVCYYAEQCTWGWTCNEQLASEWASKFLNKELPIFYSYWDMEMYKWSNFVSDIYE